MDPGVRGWIVTAAGAGINLALGVLYAWPVMTQALVMSRLQGGAHGWSFTQAASPFVVAVIAFSVTMVFSGRIRDRYGPRWVATAGGVMVGLGLVVASLSPLALAPGALPATMLIGFGLMSGIGIGLAYGAVTPAAVKWFPPRRRGLVVGVVVAGFGLSPILTAPATAALVASLGVDRALLYMGIALLVVIVALAQLVDDPLPGFVAPGTYAEPPGAAERTWHQTVRTPAFWGLWSSFALASFAGLAAAGILTGFTPLLGAISNGGWSASLIVALAIGNGLGRPLAGVLSDRIGRRRAIVGFMVVQAGALLATALAGGALPAVPAAVVVGLTFGATLALFPSATFDYFGTRHAGANYGLVFTAWGVGGVAGWLFSARIATSVDARPDVLLSCFALYAACALAAAVIASATTAPGPMSSSTRTPVGVPVARG